MVYNTSAFKVPKVTSVPSSKPDMGVGVGDFAKDDMQPGQVKAPMPAPVNMLGVKQAATAADTSQTAAQNPANANLAQLPEVAAEMQPRARLQAAQPNEGAGPGNPTSAANNQPGQPAGLIAGQMLGRRA